MRRRGLAAQKAHSGQKPYRLSVSPLYNLLELGQSTVVRSYNTYQGKKAEVQELSMEKILQSKTILMFGLLLICALFVIMYKYVPLQQNEVSVQPNINDWANMTHLNTTSKWCNGHLRFLDPPGHSIYIRTVSS